VRTGGVGMRGNVVAVMAGCSALLAPAPVALARNGFPDYRQAAADQYPAQPPPATTGSGSAAPGGSASPTSGSSGRPRPVHAANGSRPAATRRRTAGATTPSGASAPVEVAGGRLPAATGSLPFTGSDLSGLVELALVLLATGLLLGAAARATRRRRRAPA
jgi:hypothetical protein